MKSIDEMTPKDLMHELDRASKYGERVRLRNFGYFDSSYAALLEYED